MATENPTVDATSEVVAETPVEEQVNGMFRVLVDSCYHQFYVS